jgi:hypothetical protein
MAAKKRSIMRIEMDVDAKDRLEDICQRRGMTQISVMSRVVNWFSDQDDSVQTAVLASPSTGSSPALSKTLLKKLSSSGN